MWEIVITVIVAVALAYYVKDVSQKVIERYFELKNQMGELEERFSKAISELENEIRKTEHAVADGGVKADKTILQRLSSLEDKIKSLEKTVSTFKNLETKFEYRTGELTNAIRKLQERFNIIEGSIEGIKDELKEELREELLRDLQDEIEHLENVIERRKNEEVEEFLELLKASVTLQPEKLQKGIFEAKRALLSMRDIAKVYVLTGKGTKEFYELKESLIELLRNLRKLAVVSVPDDTMYSLFNQVVVNVKRLNLPMKVSSEGKEKELNPERSFIQIHKMIYETLEILEKISELIQEPVPVTPIEKEFYEKLRIQFEELQRLEQQVNELLMKLSIPVEEKDNKDKRQSLEELLKDLL